METLALLRKLLLEGKITKQQCKTYRGQVLSGNEKACIVGLKRSKLI